MGHVYNGKKDLNLVYLYVFCGYPGQLKNGSLERTNFSHNDKVYYNCDREYELVGNSNRTCLKSGKWSGSTPRCRYLGMYYTNYYSL